MSASDVEDNLPDRQITSAEPSIPLRQSLERNILGVFEVEITPSTFDPKGRLYFNEVLRSFNLQPLRETTPFHIDLIEDAFVDHQGMSSYDFTWTAVLVGNEFRDQNRSPDEEVFTLEQAREFLKGYLNTYEVISAQDAVKLAMALADGHARFQVLLKEFRNSGKIFRCFVQVYDEGVLNERQLIAEISHGRNNKQSYPFLAVQPNFGDQLRFISSVRGGDSTARTLAGVDDLVRVPFSYYSSSRSRTLLAQGPLGKSLISDLVDNERVKEKTVIRLSYWLNGAGAATAVLYVALDHTLSTFKLLEQSEEIFTRTFCFYFFKLVKNEGLVNPFAGIDPDSAGAGQKIKDNCSKTLKVLRKTLEELRPKQRIQVNKFKDVFNKSLPPWFNGTDVTLKLEPTLDLVQDFVGPLEKLISRLESDLPDVQLQSTMVSNFVTFDDLLSLSPRSQGTRYTRWLMICESHVLTPLAELLGAYVQLVRKDNSLHLPAQYYKTFQDPEPYFFELLRPGRGVNSIRAKGRNDRIQEPWFEDADYSDAYIEFLRYLCLHLEEIIKEVLAAKSRVAALDAQDRQVLLNHFVHSSQQDTSQGKLIARNLHLAFACVDADGSLTPSLPPPPYEHCVAWMRPGSNGLLKPLAKVATGDKANILDSYLRLIGTNAQFPISDSPVALSQIVNDVSVENVAKTTQSSLPSFLDSALDKIELAALPRPDSLANANSDEKEEEESNETEKQKDKDLEAGGDQASEEGEEDELAAPRRSKRKGRQGAVAESAGVEKAERGDKENVDEDSIGEGGKGKGASKTAAKGKGKVKPVPRRKKKEDDVVSTPSQAFQPTAGNPRPRSTSQARTLRHSPSVEELNVPEPAAGLEAAPVIALETEENSEEAQFPSSTSAAVSSKQFESPSSSHSPTLATPAACSSDKVRVPEPSTSRSQSGASASSSGVEADERLVHPRSSTPGPSSASKLDDFQKAKNGAGRLSLSQTPANSSPSANEDEEEDSRSPSKSYLTSSSPVQDSNGDIRLRSLSTSPVAAHSMSSAIDLERVDVPSPSRSPIFAASSPRATASQEVDAQSPHPSFIAASSTFSSFEIEDNQSQAHISNSSSSNDFDTKEAQVGADSPSHVSSPDVSAIEDHEKDHNSSFASSSASETSSFAVEKYLLGERFPERFTVPRLRTTPRTDTEEEEEEENRSASRSATLAPSFAQDVDESSDQPHSTSSAPDSSSVVAKSLLPKLHDPSVPVPSSSSTADNQELQAQTRSIPLTSSFSSPSTSEVQAPHPRPDTPSFDADLYPSFDESLERSRSLRLNAPNVFASDSTVDDLRFWKSSSMLGGNPQRTTQVQQELSRTMSALVDEVIRRFRLSNRYPPLGRSTDMANFNIDEFIHHFRAYVDERGGSETEGDADEIEGELVTESVGVEGIEISCHAMGIFMRVFKDADGEVHRYWTEFASNLPRAN